MRPVLAGELLKLRSAPGGRTALWGGVAVSVILTAAFCGLSDLRPADLRLAPAAGAGVLILYGVVLRAATAASLRRREIA